MGGSAFNEVLSPNAFPRLPPAVYQVVKAQTLVILESLYEYVGVPAEAPEKTSHGDIDFVVACPKRRESGNGTENSVVPPQIIQAAIGASYVNAMEGYRTSNFAVPVPRGEWAEYSHGEDEDMARKAVDNGEIYYQIDVNVNADREHWDRVMFFHGYGDLGMILGLLGRNAGLRLGEKGLKYPDGRNPPIDLSEIFSEILPFLGLSMDRWRTGFKTKLEIFEWVAGSRFFNATHFRSRGEGITKVKADRKMYSEFVEWVESQKRVASGTKGDTVPATFVGKEEALEYFGKAETYAAFVHARSQREKLKKAWCGSNVNQWAEMREYWKGVKLIMDTVRARLGGDDGVLDVIERKGENEIRHLVISVREELFVQVRGEDGEQRFCMKAQVPTTDGKDGTLAVSSLSAMTEQLVLSGA